MTSFERVRLRRWIGWDAYLTWYGRLPDLVGLQMIDDYEAFWVDLAMSHGGPGH